MVKRNFIVLTLFLSTLSINAQDHLIDSLKRVIEVAHHDTLVCYSYLRWGEQIYLSNPDTAVILWEIAQGIAERNLNTGSLVDPLDTALWYKYSTSLADALNNIGYIYKSQGNIEKGLEYNHKSLKVREEIGDKMGVAFSLNNIGIIYYNQGDISIGLGYLNKSLKVREEIGDKKGVAQSLNNLGTLYDNKGDTLEALEYYYKSLRIREEIGDKKGIAISLQHIGGTLCELDSVDKGILLFKKALNISSELNDKRWMGYTCDLLAEWYLKANMIDSAEYYGNWALRLAKDIKFPLNLQRASYKLSLIYRKQDSWEMALKMYELFIKMRDSINNEETQKASIRQQTKYEFEKAQLVKEQEEKEALRIEAEVMRRRDNLQYSVILIAILVLFGGVLALGFIKVSERMAEGIIFFSFLILFEFLLVLADPYIENWSGGAPGIKLLFNAGIAALIFPAHAFFESRLKGRLVESRT